MTKLLPIILLIGMFYDTGVCVCTLWDTSYGNLCKICNLGLLLLSHSCCRPAVSLPRQPFGRTTQVQEGVGQRHEMRRSVCWHQPRQCCILFVPKSPCRVIFAFPLLAWTVSKVIGYPVLVFTFKMWWNLMVNGCTNICVRTNSMLGLYCLTFSLTFWKHRN